MGRFGTGQPVRRKEDQRLLTGHGTYTDDKIIPGAAHSVVVRAPYAHAEITGMDASAAKAAPGVLAVYTIDDLRADSVGDIPCPVPVKNHDGSKIVTPPRPALADGRVRWAGQPVAFVVAETLDQARDAAELVEVDYDDLPVVTEVADAIAVGAPQIWDEAANNICVDWRAGEAAAVEDAFGKAAHVTTLRLVNNRVHPAPMENRVALGEYDSASGKFTLHTPTQGVHKFVNWMPPILGFEKGGIHVLTDDVGGGFGLKIFLYPEQVLVLYAARKLDRPVRWAAERGEGMLSDIHARDHVTEASLALDGGGKVLALRVDTLAALGGELSNFGPFIATSAGASMLVGVYDIPVADVRMRGVFTNTAPIDAYRGAGRPEAIYVIERLMDAAARELGVSPAEIRRRNFVDPAAVPYKTALGQTFDSGDFPRVFDAAMAAADVEGFEARRADAAKQGRHRGLGIACYIEVCGGAPEEQADIRFTGDGRIQLRVGNQSNGQGHETAFAQLLADRFGLEMDRIEMIQGDSAEVAFGNGTGGSRSLPVAGSAIHTAAERAIEKGKRIAAHVMEAAEADIEFDEGTFTIAGTDRRMTVHEVAAASQDSGNLPDGEEPGLDQVERHVPQDYTFPNGVHVVELEVDPATGRVAIDRYTVVDDFGVVLNPMLVEGQVHGGIAQGVGQALLEKISYDPESGQLTSGSFMDYCLPRADDLPQLNFSYEEIPCQNNPLGAKGCGEAGAIGAPPAVINGILDALAGLGVTRIDMPATPEAVWRAIREARANTDKAA